jgi:23S rRNA (pseudouridine1915-N3)-methyltransferase
VKLRLLCVGRLSAAWIRTGVEDYAGRIARYLPFETIELREASAGGSKGDIRFGRDDEGGRILQRLSPSAFVVILDEGGKALTTEAWSAFLGERMLYGPDEVSLVIGGAYGLNDAVKARGDLCFSLSKLTFPHQLARLLLLEQTYRAMTILRNEPYHNR